MIQPRTLLTAVVAVTALALFAGTGAAVPTENPGADAGASDGAGLPDELPDPVPDFVSSILDAIGQFVDGILNGNPGDEVSDSAGNEVDG